ncbi:EexN family lipoprotein [Variovorax sp. ZT4R33]|uniref:EexN family lipoprotein n=1 Tax=Variovorax sp. ZT4R33 TaxID=3443743 RepID=UPI003F488B67
MKKFRILSAVAAALLLVACDKPASIESVESLVANPERLRELRAQCKADHVKVCDAQCNAVAEATRLRFMRATPSPYANDPVRPSSPPPSPPNATPSAPKD